jgi:outer membrane protein assembly factor BamD
MKFLRRARRVRDPLFFVVLLLAVVTGCGPSFKVNSFPTSMSLYRGAMEQYDRRKWDNAIAAFDKLSLELPARDTLLPRVYYYLAVAHDRKKEHLLAAQSFTRLAETFPDDTLGDDAVYLAGKAYAKLWRRPQLDAQYGSTALATFRSLPELYPDSPLVEQATREAKRLEEWFAQKDYETGVYYRRRKAYDSALLYLRDVVTNWPETTTARKAQLEMVEVFSRINYREEARETCATLHQKFPDDREVRRVCGPPAPVTATPATQPPTPPPVPPDR